MPKRNFNWQIASFFTIVTVMAGYGVWWEIHNFHLLTVLLAIAMYLLCGLSITITYHRAGTHRAFKMKRWLWNATLVLSSGAVLLPFITWCRRHRDHHAFTDDPLRDPNCARPGFWGFLDTHIWSVISSAYRDKPIDLTEVEDPMVRWQYRWYGPIAATVGFLLPVSLSAIWGDAMGGLLVACGQRMFLQYNGAFAVNSAAHSLAFGSKPGGHWSSAVRVSWLPFGFLLAALSLGEVLGHERHHEKAQAWSTGVRGNFTDLVLRVMNRLGWVTLRES